MWKVIRRSKKKLSTQNYNLSTYGDTLFIVPSLPDNVRAEVIQWGAFEDFEEQAKTINGITLEIFKSISFFSKLMESR